MSARRLFLLSLLVVTVFRVVVAALLPLTLDEPYYWFWGRHLALGYYDHPPLVAWLSALPGVFGNAPLAVRAAPLCCSVLCAVAVHAYALRLTRSELAAAVAGVAFLVTPYYSVMFVLLSPEAGLLAAWACTLLAWHAAIFEDGSWLLAGLALGVCLLAKFTAFAVPAGLALFFVVSPQARRRWLRTPWPYFAALVALAVYSPFLWWNARHDWVTFFLQTKARSTAGFELHLERIPSFVGESLLGLSPFIAAGLVIAALRAIPAARDDEALRLPLCVSLPPLLGFWALVPLAQVQVYWTLCCFLGLYPMLGRWYAERASRRVKAGAVGCALLPMAMAVLAVCAPGILFNIARSASGLTELYAMPVVAEQMRAQRASMPHPQRTFVAAEDHRLASHLTMLLGEPAIMFTSDRRGLEYMRWEDAPSLSGQDCVLLLREPFDEGRQKLRLHLQEAFDRVEEGVELPISWNGHPARRFYVARLYGFHPERASWLLTPHSDT